MKCGRQASASLHSSVACSSRAKQVRSCAAALVNGERGFRADYPEAEKPAQDQHGDTSGRASYSDELMAAFKRKTQELCDETRERCEQRLERQEAQHERQVQSLQRQLRDVVGSCVSLAEHEQILATTAQEQQRQLEEIRRRHHSEMHEFEQRCNQKWQAKIAAFKTQSEQEKSRLTQRIEQLELHQSEAAAEAKEHELAELRWSEKLEAAAREKAEVEKRVDDTNNRLGEACRIIVALKTRLRHHKRLARDLELQRDKNSATRDEVVQCKLAYAELKGGMDTRVATLERELDHALRAVADEKANACALQSEVAGLRDQLQRQQCATAELSAKGALSSEHRASERKQLQKEVEGLQRALQQEKQSVKEAVARMDEMQQRAAEAQLQHQTLVQDLRTRLELQQATEASLKRQGQRLRQRVEQFKAVAEKLHAENKQLGEEVHNRDASTEAWARKLFGGK